MIERNPKSEEIKEQMQGLMSGQEECVEKFRRECPAAIAVLEEDFYACIAHLTLPKRHHKFIRTTNLLERLFLEERRRTKINPNMFGERAVVKLI